MENRESTLQSLCFKMIKRSIIRGETVYLKRIHMCPTDFRDELLSLCTPKQLRAAERGSEKFKADLDTSMHWKALCKKQFYCNRKAPDITWRIKYELLQEEKKREEKEYPKAFIEKYKDTESKSVPLARVVKGKGKERPRYGKKRTSVNKTKIFVLPSGKVCRCGVDFLK